MKHHDDMTNHRTHLRESGERCYRIGMTLGQALATLRGLDRAAWTDEDSADVAAGWHAARAARAARNRF